MGSVVGLLDPQCASPSYLLPSADVAAGCGRLYASLLALLAAAVALFFGVKRVMAEQDERERALEAGAVAGCLLIGVLVARWTGGLLASRHWQALKGTASNWMRAGLSKADAAKQLQQDAQSSSLNSSLGLIGAGLLSRR